MGQFRGAGLGGNSRPAAARPGNCTTARVKHSKAQFPRTSSRWAPERSLSPPAVASTRFVDTLRNRTSRSLTTAEREQIATIAEKKPSIDLVTRSVGRPMFPNGMGVAVIDATYPR
jgi:hypothetical protein